MELSAAGLSFIKSFEGLRLEAYPDPGTGGDPWTIGYGCTEGVHPGMSITEDQAERMLLEELKQFETAVKDFFTISLSQGEYDALVSFSYNCGAGALKSSTLRKRLHSESDRCSVYQEEMLRWVNSENGPMPGLVRRRQAEADMACEGISLEDPDLPGYVVMPEEAFLINAARYFNEEPHQIAAWEDLWRGLPHSTQESFKAAYRGSQEPSEAVFPLDAPYFYQRDSKTGHGERMCFSSSMAMALDFIDPDAIEGDDDWYLQEVFKFGDSVSSDAQVAAARSLGFAADFYSNGSEQDLLDHLDRGIPCPVGILHHGHVDSPSGGGHWITLIGYDEKYFHVHDPFGQLDLISGGYAIDNGPVAGKDQRYTRKNLMKRWLISSDSDGWWVKLG
jgi:GH24 family phage-related lysozyme (muramidase)